MSDTKDVVLGEIVNHFWNSKKDGVLLKESRDHYHFFLTDGKGDTINDFINTTDSSVPIPFTVGDWCNQNKQSRPRLFLMTKHMLLIQSNFSSSEDFENDYTRPIRKRDGLYDRSKNTTETIVISSDTSTNDLDNMPLMSTPADHSPTTQSTQLSLTPISFSPIPNQLNFSAPVESGTMSSQPLIGTSEDRQNLFNEMDAEYQKSLEVD